MINTIIFIGGMIALILVVRTIYSMKPKNASCKLKIALSCNLGTCEACNIGK